MKYVAEISVMNGQGGSLKGLSEGFLSNYRGDTDIDSKRKELKELRTRLACHATSHMLLGTRCHGRDTHLSIV